MNDLHPAIFGLAAAETPDMPSARSVRIAARRRLKNAQRLQTIREVLPRIPAPGEQIHTISDGKFDYWLFVPAIVKLIGPPAEFYGSTWTMSRPNVQDMMELFDQGQLSSINILTGTYFKRRETAVYSMLVAGIQARGQRYKAFENHTKIILLHRGRHYISIEGSANFTANPRLEQQVITNDRTLYNFHRSWMEEMLNA